MDLSERVLAEQMTLLDSQLFLAVRTDEWISWCKRRDGNANAPHIRCVCVFFDLFVREYV